MRSDDSLAILFFNVQPEWESEESKKDEQKTAGLREDLKRQFKEVIPRQAAIESSDNGALLILIRGIRKEEALMLSGKLRQVFETHVSKKGISGQVLLKGTVAHFPEDSTQEEELFRKAFP